MPQPRITAQYVDSMMASRRVQEDYTRGLDNYTTDTVRLGLAAKMENDIVARRRAGNMARVQASERAPRSRALPGARVECARA